LNAISARFSNGSRRIVLAAFFISHRNAQSTPDMIPSSFYGALPALKGDYGGHLVAFEEVA
jgi:hypothetical protein